MPSLVRCQSPPESSQHCVAQASRALMPMMPTSIAGALRRECGYDSGSLGIWLYSARSARDGERGRSVAARRAEQIAGVKRQSLQEEDRCLVGCTLPRPTIDASSAARPPAVGRSGGTTTLRVKVSPETGHNDLRIQIETILELRIRWATRCRWIVSQVVFGREVGLRSLKEVGVVSS